MSLLTKQTANACGGAQGSARSTGLKTRNPEYSTVRVQPLPLAKYFSSNTIRKGSSQPHTKQKRHHSACPLPLLSMPQPIEMVRIMFNITRSGFALRFCGDSRWSYSAASSVRHCCCPHCVQTFSGHLRYIFNNR